MKDYIFWSLLLGVVMVSFAHQIFIYVTQIK